MKRRTLNKNSTTGNGSHVKEFGTRLIKKEKVQLYQGAEPLNEKLTANEAHLNKPVDVTDQRDVELLFLWQKVCASI